MSPPRMLFDLLVDVSSPSEARGGVLALVTAASISPAYPQTRVYPKSRNTSYLLEPTVGVKQLKSPFLQPLWCLLTGDDKWNTEEDISERADSSLHHRLLPESSLAQGRIFFFPWR